MKKILSAVLALCLIMSALLAVSCGKEPTARELVETATAKYENLDAYEGRLEYDITMNIQGVTMSVPISADIKMTDIKSGSPIIDMNMTMEVMGQKVDMRMYLEGEWAYYDMLGMKYKTKVAQADTEITGILDNMMSNSGGFDYLDSAEIVKHEDGLRSVAVEIGENISDIIGAAANDMASSVIGEGGEIELSNLKLEYFIDKNDFIAKINCAFKMAITIEGEKVDATADMTVSFEKFDDEVQITPPEGYLDYTEAEM